MGMDDQRHWPHKGERAHVRGESPARETAVPRDHNPPRGTVLVAENEASNRLLMEQILRLAGYATVIASNGREALDLLAQHQVHLVLLDLSMPIMDGYRTTTLIRQMPRGETLPIIAVTAHAHGTAREDALDAGFTDYLTKPFRPRDLLRIVEQYVHIP